jgi:pimeloyl-ACP methyl ester carboxylesterase/class 3 adenylate cyclase
LRRVSQRGQTWEVTPETKYARTGDGLSVAYQVVGKGPLDLLFVPGYQSNLELNWDLPAYARMLDRLASFSRLIAVDRRGTGLSDRLSPADHPPLETLMDDLRRVMDAVGSEQAALAGFLDGGFLCALFAATYPERTRALVLYGSSASGKWSLDYPWQWKPDRWERFIDDMAAGWGKQDFADQTLRWYAPSAYPDEVTRRWWARYQWLSSSPSSAVAIERLYSQTDVRHLLPSIRVQTLVIHRRDDPAEAVEGARFIAQQIPAAKYVELEGVDSPPWAGDSDILVDEIEEFLTGIRRGPEHDRVLATVLFTDIVDSTRKAAELGDRRWRALLDAHDAKVRAELVRFRGSEVDNAGDGFFATFDGPARAVQCARAIGSSVRDLKIEIRAGVHTGEIERARGGVRGISVHVGARVAGLARPGEVLVSSTVKDLVAGSGLAFEDRGGHELRGVPGTWQLYAASD